MEDKKKESSNVAVLSIVFTIVFCIFGVLLIAFPDAIISFIAYALAAIVLLIGMFGLYKFFLAKDESNYTKYGLAYGVLFIVLALFILFKKADMIKILPYTVGALIIVSSVLKIDSTVRLKHDDNENWKVTLAVTTICFLLGIILLFFPLQSIAMVVRVIGVIIICFSILDLINSYIIRTNLNKTLDIVMEDAPLKDEVIKEEAIVVVKDAPVKETTVKKKTTRKKKSVKDTK